MYKIFLAIAIIICLFLGAIFSSYIVPNFLNIDFANYNLTMKLFSNISVILASIFGIIIAIFLISFQIFKRNYVSYSMKDFFKDPNISFLFLVYLSTILISYLSLTFIKVDYYSNKIVNLYYLSFFLFLICISCLYFFVKLILTSNYINDKVQKVILSLTYDDISNYFKKYSYFKLENDFINIDKNPHLFLEEMFSNAVKRKDTHAISIFYSTLYMKTLLLLNKFKNTEEIHKIFKFLGKLDVNTAQVAINEHEKLILKTILDKLFPTYLYCIGEDIIGENLKELNITIRYILILIVESKNMLNIDFYVYLAGIKKFIVDLVKKQDKDSNTNPVENQIEILLDVTDRAIKNNLNNCAMDGLNIIIDIVYEVIEETDISKSRKKDVIRQCCEHYKYLILKMFDRGLHDKNILVHPFNFIKMFNIVKCNTDFSNRVLILYCEILLELANRDIFYEFYIRNLGVFGIKIIIGQSDIVNSNEFILYIFRVLNKLRKIIEKSPERLLLDKYGILCTQIEHLKKLIDDNKKEFTKIEKEIFSIYEIFMKSKPLFVEKEPLDWPDVNQ